MKIKFTVNIKKDGHVELRAFHKGIRYGIDVPTEIYSKMEGDNKPSLGLCIATGTRRFIEKKLEESKLLLQER